MKNRPDVSHLSFVLPHSLSFLLWRGLAGLLLLLATRTTFLLLVCSDQIRNKRTGNARVLSVTAGDTFILEDGRKVRLVGINAPARAGRITRRRNGSLRN